MKVVEKFVSINGEGQKAGQLAFFVRFAGCNLNCGYCDTKWANKKDVAFEEYTPEELVDIILDSGVDNVTLTGGEPLLQPEMKQLLEGLSQAMKERMEKEKERHYRIEIETNGSIDISPFMDYEPVCFTLDYKMSVSGMEDRMCRKNYENIRRKDTVKFVVGSRQDMERARMVVDEYQLLKKGCGIYFSPCFGKIEPADMVAYLMEETLNGVNIQLQMHKFIWDPDKRGV